MIVPIWWRARSPPVLRSPYTSNSCWREWEDISTACPLDRSSTLWSGLSYPRLAYRLPLASWRSWFASLYCELWTRLGRVLQRPSGFWYILSLWPSVIWWLWTGATTWKVYLSEAVGTDLSFMLLKQTASPEMVNFYPQINFRNFDIKIMKMP